jgi:hypothetical protein
MCVHAGVGRARISPDCEVRSSSVEPERSRTNRSGSIDLLEPISMNIVIQCAATKDPKAGKFSDFATLNWPICARLIWPTFPH